MSRCETCQRDLEELLEAATRGRAGAYVPYSGFAMGAAVGCDGGDVVAGALVENVSLGLAMCAERVALFRTVVDGTTPTDLVLVSKRTAGQLTFPCGACLQVALELGGPGVRVHAFDPDGAHECATVAELLPRGPRLERS